MTDIVSMLHRGFKLNPDLFEPIEIGNFTMSIQASRYHHCSPQQDIPPYLYSSMEVKIYDSVKNKTPREIIENLPYRYEECGDHFAYVTVQELQWMYDYLWKVYYEKEDLKHLAAASKKFYKWRDRAVKQLPALSARIFALRNKHYVGCGFHYSLEKTLGYVTWKLNDFDNIPRTARDMRLHYLAMEIHLDGLFEDVVKAERSVSLNANSNSNE